jgi:hypothetical protein
MEKKNVNNSASGEDNGCVNKTKNPQRSARAITIKNLRIFSLPSARLLSMLPATPARRAEEIL